MRPYPNRERALHQLGRHISQPVTGPWRGPLIRIDFGITPEKIAAINRHIAEAMPILLPRR